MTAKPDVVGAIAPETARVPVSVMNGIVAKFEENELEIESLRRQRAGLIEKNAILQEQVNEAQLQASHQIALSKFAEVQMYERLLKLERRCSDLEMQGDRIANFLTPFAGLRDQLGKGG